VVKDIEPIFADWQKNGDTVAFYRVGIGVSMAFTGKIFRAPMGVWAVGGRNGGSSFDVSRAECRCADLSIPSVLQEVMGTVSAPGVELLLETGEQCWLWRVPRQAS
jgi:hypothetical protein